MKKERQNKRETKKKMRKEKRKKQEKAPQFLLKHFHFLINFLFI